MVETAERKNLRKKRIGIVLSNKMSKTIVVQIRRKALHPFYGKVIEKAVKFKAHDEKNTAKIGDRVSIEETRPVSKQKRWRLVEILKRGERHEDREAQRIAELEALGVQRKKEVKKQLEGVEGAV